MKRNASRKSQEARRATEDTNTTSNTPDCPEVFSQLQIEAVAQYAHEAWAAYMKHFLAKTYDVAGGVRGFDDAYYYALLKQINTPYDKLTAAEKKLDIEEAKKICMLFYIG